MSSSGSSDWSETGRRSSNRPTSISLFKYRCDIVSARAFVVVLASFRRTSRSLAQSLEPARSMHVMTSGVRVILTIGSVGDVPRKQTTSAVRVALGLSRSPRSSRTAGRAASERSILRSIRTSRVSTPRSATSGLNRNAGPLWHQLANPTVVKVLYGLVFAIIRDKYKATRISRRLSGILAEVREIHLSTASVNREPLCARPCRKRGFVAAVRSSGTLLRISSDSKFSSFFRSESRLCNSFRSSRIFFATSGGSPCAARRTHPEIRLPAPLYTARRSSRSANFRALSRTSETATYSKSESSRLSIACRLSRFSRSCAERKVRSHRRSASRETGIPAIRTTAVSPTQKG